MVNQVQVVVHQWSGFRPETSFLVVFKVLNGSDIKTVTVSDGELIIGETIATELGITKSELIVYYNRENLTEKLFKEIMKSEYSEPLMVIIKK